MGDEIEQNSGRNDSNRIENNNNGNGTDIYEQITNFLLETPLQCRVCYEVFVEMVDLKHHLMQHLGITDYVDDDEIDKSCHISDTNDNLNESICNDNSRIDNPNGISNKTGHVKNQYYGETPEDCTELKQISDDSLKTENDNFNESSYGSDEQEYCTYNDGNSSEISDNKQQSNDYILKEEIIEIEEHPVKIEEDPIENDINEKQDQKSVFIKGAKRIIQHTLKTVLKKPIEKDSQNLKPSIGSEECRIGDQNESRNGTNIVGNTHCSNDENNQNTTIPGPNSHVTKQPNRNVNTVCILGEYLKKHLQNFTLKIQSKEEESECLEKNLQNLDENAHCPNDENSQNGSTLGADDSQHTNENVDAAHIPNKHPEKYLQHGTVIVESNEEHVDELPTTNKLYCCQICCELFSENSEFQKHLEKHLPTHQCKVCDKRFCTKEMLSMHLNLHFEGQRKIHERKKLDRITNNIEALPNDSNSIETENCKNDEKPQTTKTTNEQSTENESYQCEMCDKRFPQECLLREHMRFLHCVQITYKCNSCTETFRTKRQLDSHTKLHKKLLPCYVCGKKFTYYFLLRNHQKRHRKKKLFKCDHCGKQFATLSLLKYHLILHTGKKKYQCGTCGKKFALFHYLQTHSKNHNDGMQLCDRCGKQYGSRNGLQYHLKVHTGDRAYHCGRCGKNFTTDTTLKSHLFLHKGEKKHQCYVCNRKFVRLKNFKNHLVVHTDEQPYCCGTCGKRFSLENNLKKHTKIHTGQM